MHEFFEKIDVFNKISFDEDWHSYKLDGCRTVSVTKVTGSIVPPFEKEKKAAEKAAKLTAEGTPTTPEQLINEWDLNNLYSSSLPVKLASTRAVSLLVSVTLTVPLVWL